MPYEMTTRVSCSMLVAPLSNVRNNGDYIKRMPSITFVANDDAGII